MATSNDVDGNNDKNDDDRDDDNNGGNIDESNDDDRHLSGDWGPGLADCSLSENNCDERIYNCSFFAECF